MQLHRFFYYFQTMFKKHPKALPFLFLAETWERFGFYLMVGIFTLYLKDVKEGFAMNERESADLYGTFIAFVFFTPFLGGIVADRFFGYRKSVLIGGLLMGVGYLLMSIHHIQVLYISLFLVIMGNGLLKPNISTLLGNAYNKEEFLAKKDEGFNIFYMGINIGAFVCNFIAAIIYTNYGWGKAFIAAGIGMFIGIFIFIIGNKHFAELDVKKELQDGDMSMKEILYKILLPALVTGIIGLLIPNNIFGSDSTDAFIFGSIPVIYFYYSLYKNAKGEDKTSLKVLLSIFAVVLMFWSVFKQNGTTLNTWADNYTNRKVEGKTEHIFNTFQFTKKITYQKDSVALYDSKFRLQKVNGKPLKEWNYPIYFRNDVTAYQENQSIHVWTTNLSQSINPFFVIAFTPLVVALFTWLRRNKKEPSTPTKMVIGLFISTLSVIVMIAAVYIGKNGAEKVSVWWLIGSYAVVTAAELLISPMALSLASKLSPKRMAGILMGGWFLATSIGNKLSGILASQWDKYDNKANYFWLNFALLLAASIVLLFMVKNLNKVMKEKGIQ